MIDDVLIGTVTVLGSLVAVKTLRLRLKRPPLMLDSDFWALSAASSAFSGKVETLEDYARNFWQDSAEDEDLKELMRIREELNQAIVAVRELARDGKTSEAKQLTQILLEHASPSAERAIETVFPSLIKWESRSRKLILRVCQKLTLEANSPHSDEISKKYKRKPTLLSLREISEMLREERTARPVQ